MMMTMTMTTMLTSTKKLPPAKIHRRPAHPQPTPLLLLLLLLLRLLRRLLLMILLIVPSIPTTTTSTGRSSSKRPDTQNPRRPVHGTARDRTRQRKRLQPDGDARAEGLARAVVDRDAARAEVGG